MFLSIIVPVFNEEGAVANLHREILEMCLKLGVGYDMRGAGEAPIALNEDKTTPSPYPIPHTPYPVPHTPYPSFEIIFVNDGSSDKTLDVLKALSPIKIVNLRRNSGQTAAIDAGIKQAKGDIIITMDGDGQNDPADISALLNRINEGFDVVSGWRSERKDTRMKCFVSRGARMIRSLFIRDLVHDSGCTLKAYRRECFVEVDLYGEMHRFIPAVLAWRGFTVSEVPVRHRPRTTGKTKYNWKRIPKGFLDIVNVWFWWKFSNRPLHLFGGAGLFLGFIGSFGLFVLLILRTFRIVRLANSVFPLLAVFCILAGLQLFVSGLLADMIIRGYYKTTNQKSYQVKEVIEL